MASNLLSPLYPINGTPVTIVFGTFNFRYIIRNWIDHALSSCEHWKIICLDRQLVDWLDKAGHGAHVIYLYDLLPHSQHKRYKLSYKDEQTPKKEDIFRIRKYFFSTLASSGISFVHSDADALWLQNIHPWLEKHNKFDILISQGTLFPKKHHNIYNFTCCAGFFFCRANARTKLFFKQVEKFDSDDDQISINNVLLSGPGNYWYDIHQPTTWVLPFYPRNISKWYRVPTKTPSPFLPSLRYYLYKLFSNNSLYSMKYIHTSPEIIEGKYNNNLTIGIIPMSVVDRINIKSSTPPLITHPPNFGIKVNLTLLSITYNLIKHFLGLGIKRVKQE